MKSISAVCKWTLMVLLTLQFLAACSSKTATPAANQGTTDSGGGNGLDGKVFEAYKVVPQSQPAFQKHLAKIFAAPAGSGDTRNFSGTYFQMRTWYIAPVELKGIEKGVLGVSFMESKIDQLALQTKNEVWINKRYFDAMSTEDQAQLILHELVMTIYLLKFEPLSAICKFSIPDPKGSASEDSCRDGAVRDQLDALYPAEPLRPLKVEDYENIRYVTGWLYERKDVGINDIEIASVFKARGFAKWLWSSTLRDATKAKSFKAKASDLATTIQGAKLAGSAPTTCFLSHLGTSAGCDFELSEGKPLFGTVATYHFKLSSPGQTAIEFDFMLENGDGKGESDLFPVEGQKRDDLYMRLIASVSPRVRVGDHSYIAYLIFSRPRLSENGVRFHSVILSPSVVTRIDKAQSPMCATQPLAAKGFATDVLILASSQVEADEVAPMASLVVSGGAFCSEFNIPGASR